MKVSIYAGQDYKKLDLFEDENISLTSKLSDIEKLSNVFTDFSDSFTIPASATNNQVFKHYYDFDIDNSFNANIRIPAYIEIDTIPFRFGEFQLESVTVKNFQPDNYKITFYSNTTQLSKLFDNDLLSELDYEKVDGVNVRAFSGLSQFDYLYNSTNVINSINNPSFKDGDLITPLINYSDKDWNYGGGNSDNVKDISIDSGAIDDVDLRPALRLIKIIEAIETKYGITFSREFFNTAPFQDLYMWLNEREENLLTDKQEVDITIPFTGTNNGYFSQSGNILYVQRRIYSESIFDPYVSFVRYFVRPTDTTIKYSLIIENENGDELARRDNLTGNQNIEKRTDSILGNNTSTELTTDSYRLKIITQASNTFETDVNVQAYKFGPTVYVNVFSYVNTNLLDVSIIIETNMPKIKVIDFITSIMKMFKLVIRPLSLTSFTINTLDGYYSLGNILDVTQYIDNDSVLIERPELYSEIYFKYEKTDNFLGQKFRIDNNPITEVGYGDLLYKYSEIENKKELEVKVNFENMLFENISDSTGTTTNIMTGFAASSSDNGITFSANKSKPILFYNNGINNHNSFPIKFRFNGSLTTAEIVYSYNIGNTNNEYLNQVSNSVNFGIETDQWHQQEITSNLYSNYWTNWIESIYNLKQRKVKYKGYLPQRFINELSLNDRLIIGSQRFKINDYTINLVTSEVNLNLFKDIFTTSLPIEMNGVTLSGASYLTDWATASNGLSVYLYGSQSVGYLSQINFDGTQNETLQIGTGFNANSFGFTTILNDNGKLLVTGNFTQYNGTTANRLIRLNSNGSIDSTFATGTGFNNYSLKALKTVNDKYIIVGNFTTYSGVTSNRIVSLNDDGTIDTSLVIGSGFNNTGIDLVTDADENLYITGYFTSYSGVTANRLIKLDSTGNIVSAFNAGSGPNTISNQPNGLVYNQNGLYMYGYFTSYSGVSAGRICKLVETTAEIDTNFNLSGSGFNNIVYIAKTIYDNKLLVSGGFTTYNGITVDKHVVLNGDGSLYYIIPSGYTYVYNINNNIYGVNGDGLIELISENTQDFISTDNIVTNAGIKTYDFSVVTSKSWEIIKVDTGYDVDWVDIIQNQSANGSALVTFRVAEKASQSAPDVYEERDMQLQVLYSDGSSRFLRVTQLGLIL